jgi:hypothetical protein
LRVELRVTVEAESPTPVNATECGLSPALSVISRAAFLFPVDAGVNATFTSILLPGAKVTGKAKLELIAKSDAFVPESEIVDSTRSAEPVFVIAIGCGAPVVRIFWGRKESVATDKLTCGAGVLVSRRIGLLPIVTWPPAIFVVFPERSRYCVYRKSGEKEIEVDEFHTTND